MLIEEDLRELDHGELEGLTFNEIKTRYGEFLTRWRSEPADIRVPGGERLADVAERAWNGLNEIVQRHPDAATHIGGQPQLSDPRHRLPNHRNSSQRLPDFSPRPLRRDAPGP